MAPRREDTETQSTGASHNQGVIELTKEERQAAERALFGQEVGRPQGVYSTAEWAEYFGISETSMRKHIREAIKMGAMEQVRYIDIDAIGRRQPHTGYQLVKAEQS